MSHQGTVAPDLEMVEAHLPLPIFEEPLDVPAREGYEKQLLERNFGRGIRQEVLQLAGQDFPRDQESFFLARDSIAARKKPHLPDLPHYRPLVRPLDLVLHPGESSAKPQLRNRPRL